MGFYEKLFSFYFEKWRAEPTCWDRTVLVLDCYLTFVNLVKTLNQIERNLDSPELARTVEYISLKFLKVFRRNPHLPLDYLILFNHNLFDFFADQIKHGGSGSRHTYSRTFKMIDGIKRGRIYSSAISDLMVNKTLIEISNLTEMDATTFFIKMHQERELLCSDHLRRLVEQQDPARLVHEFNLLNSLAQTQSMSTVSTHMISEINRFLNLFTEPTFARPGGPPPPFELIGLISPKSVKSLSGTNVFLLAHPSFSRFSRRLLEEVDLRRVAELPYMNVIYNMNIFLSYKNHQKSIFAASEQRSLMAIYYIVLRKEQKFGTTQNLKENRFNWQLLLLHLNVFETVLNSEPNTLPLKFVADVLAAILQKKNMLVIITDREKLIKSYWKNLQMLRTVFEKNLLPDDVRLVHLYQSFLYYVTTILIRNFPLFSYKNRCLLMGNFGWALDFFAEHFRARQTRIMFESGSKTWHRI